MVNASSIFFSFCFYYSICQLKLLIEDIKQHFYSQRSFSLPDIISHRQKKKKEKPKKKINPQVFVTKSDSGFISRLFVKLTHTACLVSFPYNESKLVFLG